MSALEDATADLEAARAGVEDGELRTKLDTIAVGLVETADAEADDLTDAEEAFGDARKHLEAARDAVSAHRSQTPGGDESGDTAEQR